ncbi:MAG: Fur family transcriptional regulator [Paracoccaceae bacterium]
MSSRDTLPPDTVLATFARRAHDRRARVAAGLAAAERLCAAEAALLTPQRRRVLELLLAAGRPLRAYALVDRLAAGGHGVAPMTVYRALDFLLAHGLVHRIESLAAYVACARLPEPHPAPPRKPHGGYFLLCDGCGAAAEIEAPSLDAAAAEAARPLAFRIDRLTLEVHGLCRACGGGDDEGGGDAR